MQTPENKKISNKKYRDSHKEEIRKYLKEYNLKNNEKLKQQKREFHWKNRDKILVQKRKNYWKTHTPFVSKWDKLGITKKEYKKLLDKKYNESHQEEIKIKQRENYLKNREKCIAQATKRRRAHPELKLQYDLKALKKCGFPLKLPAKQYKYALHAWSKTVKKLGNGLCLVCNRTADVSHHIIHKAKYPGLSLNIHNGIPLCLQCHNQVHAWK